MTALHVAVGVILDGQDHILITRRPDAAHQGGLWEFPGGKVEAGETAEQALARELAEELGITVGRCSPLLRIEHDYGDRRVLLDVHVVWTFAGTAQALEGQPMRWVTPWQLGGFEFPRANQPIITAAQALRVS